jgi:hypothetical protein
VHGWAAAEAVEVWLCKSAEFCYGADPVAAINIDWTL